MGLWLMWQWRKCAWGKLLQSRDVSYAGVCVCVRQCVHFAFKSTLTTGLDGVALHRGRHHNNEVSRIRAYTVRSAEHEKHHLLRKMFTKYV